MEETYERIRDPTWLSGKGKGEGQWSSGLCDCFSDCRKCIISIIPIVNTFDVAHTYNVMDSKEGIMGEIFVVRSKFHDAPYNIKPTFSFCPLAVEDFCCALFCGWCAIQQCQRHLDGIEGGLPAYLFAPESKNTMNEPKTA